MSVHSWLNFSAVGDDCLHQYLDTKISQADEMCCKNVFFVEKCFVCTFLARVVNRFGPNFACILFAPIST